MVPRDGMGAIETVDDTPGAEGIVAVVIEIVFERASGEVAPVGPAQDHPLNQDLSRDVRIERKFRLFQERQAHQITHKIVILVPGQLDIAAAVKDLIRPGINLATLFHFSAIRFTPAFPPLFYWLHGMSGLVIGCGQHIGSPAVVGDIKFIKCSKLVENSFPLAVAQLAAEEGSVDFLKEKMPVHDAEGLSLDSLLHKKNWS